MTAKKLVRTETGYDIFLAGRGLRINRRKISPVEAVIAEARPTKGEMRRMRKMLRARGRFDILKQL